MASTFSIAMASYPNFDDDADFGVDYTVNLTPDKRPPLDDDEDFKDHIEEEDHSPGATTGIILNLRDSKRKFEEECKYF